MKADLMALALRLEAALFLFTLTVAALFLIGSAQSFSENTLRSLFTALRWLAWIGLLTSWLGLLPWSARKKSRFVGALFLGLGFGIVFVLVLVWGSWVYPGVGAFPW